MAKAEEAKAAQPVPTVAELDEVAEPDIHLGIQRYSMCRTKAFNAVALVGFVMTEWGRYCRTHLPHHANHKETSH